MLDDEVLRRLERVGEISDRTGIARSVLRMYAVVNERRWQQAEEYAERRTPPTHEPSSPSGETGSENV